MLSTHDVFSKLAGIQKTEMTTSVQSWMYRCIQIFQETIQVQKKTEKIKHFDGSIL